MIVSKYIIYQNILFYLQFNIKYINNCNQTIIIHNNNHILYAYNTG